MKYRPEIDGLRCLAIVPVVLYHAGARFFPGGFVGVDVFFVISGFLITSIIRREIDQRTFTIAGFYERRCRRILPALIVVILASLSAGYFIMLAGQYAALGSSAAATLLFSSNVFFWRQVGYFGPVAEWLPLLNTWSLAVEEQYYIVFPLFMLVARRWPVARQVAFIGIIFAASLLVSVHGAYQRPGAAFFLTPFRAWELLLGVLIAYQPRPNVRERWLREVASLVGLLLIALPVALYDDGTPFPGLAALAPCLGTGILLVTGDAGASLVKSALENRVLVFIGQISYSLYLWHWPVLVFARLRFAETQLSPTLATVCVLASFLIATLSWRFIERPFRRKEAFDRARIFTYSAASVLFSFLISMAICLSGGVPTRVLPEALAFEKASADIDPFRDRCQGRVDDSSCQFGAEEPTPVSFALWGDSHAAALRPALEEAMAETGKKGVLMWQAQCPPLLGATRLRHLAAKECHAFRERAIGFLTAPRSSIDTVFLSARWPAAETSSFAIAEKAHGHLFEDEQSEELGPQENQRVFARSLRRTIERLRAANKKVVIVGGIPVVGWDVPAMLALSAQHRVGVPQPPSRSETERQSEFVDSVFERFARLDGVAFIPVIDLMCSERCRVTAENRALYSDRSHLSLFGAKRFLGPALRSRFESSRIWIEDED
jgi:peptidoglycan/LPS O-acetylase OafA/YrhL